EELTKAQTERYQKEALYRLVQAGDYGSLPGVVENKLIQDLSERLADLKRELAQLSTKFNAEYPRVKEIQSQIDEIEGTLKEERQRARQNHERVFRRASPRELGQGSAGRPTKTGEPNRRKSRSIQHSQTRSRNEQAVVRRIASAPERGRGFREPKSQQHSNRGPCGSAGQASEAKNPSEPRRWRFAGTRTWNQHRFPSRASRRHP